jgi:hypothetical protein
MEDLPEVGNLQCGCRSGDQHREARRCRGDRHREGHRHVLDTSRRCLDTRLHPCSQVWDNGCRQCRGDIRHEEGQVRYDMYFQQLYT